MSKRRRNRQSAAGVDPIAALAGQMVAESVAADPSKVEMSADVRERLAAFEAATEAAAGPLLEVYRSYDALIALLRRSPLIEAQTVGMRVVRQLHDLERRYPRIPVED